MIDTVKMICPINRDIYDIIYRKAEIKSSKNNETGKVNYEITTKQLEGSYDSRLQVRPELASKYQFDAVYTDYILIVEGSFTKVLHGHNITGTDNLHWLAFKIIKLIENEFSIKLPNTCDWYLYKVDITYSYKIGNNNKDLLNYLNNLKAINYNQRKKVILYDTSIMCKSSTALLKIYAKYNEFLFNDYKRFYKSKNKVQNELGEKLLKFSENLLRLECSIKIRKLKDMYNGKKYIQLRDIRIADLKKIWSDEFMKFFNVLNFAEFKTVSQPKAVKERLQLYYKQRTANDLYSFWIQCSQFGVIDTRENNTKSTFNRKYKQLKDVGIMIGTELQIEETDKSYEFYHFNPFTEKAI